MWIKYVMGGATMAYQRSEVDYAAATSRDEESDHYGISFAVNEDLTVSAGRQEVDLVLQEMKTKNLQVFLHLTQWVV